MNRYAVAVALGLVITGPAVAGEDRGALMGKSITECLGAGGTSMTITAPQSTVSVCIPNGVIDSYVEAWSGLLATSAGDTAAEKEKAEKEKEEEREHDRMVEESNRVMQESFNLNKSSTPEERKRVHDKLIMFRDYFKSRAARQRNK